MRRKRWLGVLLAMAWAFGACTPQAAYIEADRATFDVIGASWLDYVRADEGLDEEQIGRRERLVDSWRIRLEKAEGGAP